MTCATTTSEVTADGEIEICILIIIIIIKIMPFV